MSCKLGQLPSDLSGCRRRRGSRAHRWQTPAAIAVGVIAGIYLCNWFSLVSFSLPCLTACCAGKNDSTVEELPRSNRAGGSREIKKRLVLVGVLTAQKFIDTRAAAVFSTWAKSIPGDVIFFSSEGTKASTKFRVVSLPGVDDTYPPQKKSFMMLKYMHESYGEQYDWFMRVDDDVYIKGDRLATFLHSVNSSRPLFIGQSGQGSKDELGQLSLSRDENFCMGGPGMILSKSALAMVAPNVGACLRSLYTTHEDVEVGRCIRRFAAIQCTWSFEMPRLFYHNYAYKDKMAAASFPQVLLNRHVEPAITMHPVKTGRSMHRVHNDVLARRSKLLRHRAVVIGREISVMSEHLRQSTPLLAKGSSTGDKYPSNGWTSDTNDHFSQAQPWETFTMRDMYTLSPGSPRRGMPQPLQAFLRDVQWQAMENLGKYAKQQGGFVQLKELYRGFWKTSNDEPDGGVKVVLDAQLLYQRPAGRHLARRQIFIRVPFGEAEAREVSSEGGVHNDMSSSGNIAVSAGQSPAGWSNFLKGKLVDFAASVAVMASHIPTYNRQSVASTPADLVLILPLAGRTQSMSRFLRNYEDVCLRNSNENVRLVVVIFHGPESEASMAAINRLQTKYAARGSIGLLLANGPFSRGRALQLGAEHCSQDELLFFIDVDIHFDAATLHRARLNAQRGLRAYFPIVFSQYSSPLVCGRSQCDERDRSDEAGFFRHYGYGIASIYKKDLDAAGGFNLSIEGWGREDVDVCDGVARSGLDIFRAADPGLVHVYHPMECNVTMETSQFRMCYGSLTSQMASVRTMFEILKNSSLMLSKAIT